MLKSETREIGGKRYCITQLDAESGLRVFFQLVKLVGPGVASLLREWQGGAVDAQTAAGAISELLSQMTYEQLRAFVDTFQESTEVLGTDDKGVETRVRLSSIKKLAFVGEYGSLMRWLGVCLEVNYSSFFADMGLTKLRSSAARPAA